MRTETGLHLAVAGREPAEEAGHRLRVGPTGSLPLAGAEPLHLYILIGSASEARMECTDSVIVMSVYPVFRWSCWVVARDAMLRPEISVRIIVL